MGHLQRPRVYILIALVLCVCAGSAACDEQATEQNEPLRRLQGDATIAVGTGGHAVTPALCFRRRYPYRLPASFEKLPAEARKAFSADLLADAEYARIIDHGAMWQPSSEREIVEVETIGEFPAAFKIAAYLPPGDDFVQPAFKGEPAMAEGRLCAVRAEHPHVVHRPVFLNSQDHLAEADSEPVYRAMLDADSDAFHLETWRCPPDPELACVVSEEGDDSLYRNDFGIFVEAEAEPILVYLAEPAAPGSYTAWKYGAHDGLSAGFHLLDGPTAMEIALERNEQEGCRSARFDALAQIAAEYKDRVVYFLVDGLAFTNIETDPVLNEAFERRLAELTMEHCEQSHYVPVSMSESISLKFRSDRFRLSPPWRDEVQQSAP